MFGWCVIFRWGGADTVPSPNSINSPNKLFIILRPLRDVESGTKCKNGSSSEKSIFVVVC